MTTSKLLYYSPKSVERVKRLIKGKIAYIVPGKPCRDDYFLSEILNLPLFQSSPQISTQISLRSNSRKIFREAEVPTPPSSDCLFSEEELAKSLASLVYEYPHIELWIFKLNDQNNSTGFALFKIAPNSKIYEILNSEGDVHESLHQFLKRNLSAKLKIITNSLFSNFKEMLFFVKRKGCIIEASASLYQKFVQSPCISFLINPDGSLHYLGSYEKFNGKEYISSGCFYPQKSLPKLNPQAIVDSVGGVLSKKGVFGFVQLDMVSFPDPLNIDGHPLFWAIGLTNSLNEYTAGLFFHKALSERSKVEKEGLYLPYVQSPEISFLQMKTFFHMCRINGVSYDVTEHSGSIFLLLDEMQGGVVSLLSLGESREEILTYSFNSLNFILKSIGKVNKKMDDMFECQRYEGISLNELVGRIRNQWKCESKKKVQS